MQQQQTNSRSDCDMQLNEDFMTTGNDQLSGWTEKKLQSTSQSQTCTKKWRGHWWSAAHLMQHSFLNPSDTITSEKHAQEINEMHQKLQCQESGLVNRKGPVLPHNTWPYVSQPMLQKLNELGSRVLPHLPHSPDLLPTDDHFFKHLDNFWQGKRFHNPAECRKCFLRVCRILKYGFLRYRNRQTYFSLAKNVLIVDCNGSSFD